MKETHEHFNSFFKQQLENADIEHLLKLVARSKRAKVEAILVKSPTLLLKKGETTDYSGRTFKEITAFELALWYRDRRMLKLIRKYLSKEEAAKQLNEYILSETSYKKTHGNNYDLTKLINALKACVDDWNGDYKKCITELGQAQKMVPVHIANEYCNPNHLFTAQQFNEEELEYCLEIFDWDNGELMNWFPLPSKLGTKSAIFCREDFKGAVIETATVCKRIYRDEIALNLKAITALDKIISDEFEQLIRELLNSTDKFDLSETVNDSRKVLAPKI